MLNRTVGVGRGCPNYPEKPQLCTSRVACRENPREPVCLCCRVEGVTNSFLSPCKGDPPPTQQGPAPQARALGLSLTPLFCQLPYPTPAS